MAIEDATTPLASNPTPNAKNNELRTSQASNSCNPNNDCVTPSQIKARKPEEFLLYVASKIASQPLQYSDPDVWAVLTAISDKARKRRQVHIVNDIVNIGLCLCVLGCLIVVKF